MRAADAIIVYRRPTSRNAGACSQIYAMQRCLGGLPGRKALSHRCRSQGRNAQRYRGVGTRRWAKGQTTVAEAIPQCQGDQLHVFNI